MQTNHQDIYSALAKEKDKSEQVYKDIGSFIFRETARMLKDPTSLILKLKGVGSWRLRKKRMDIIINECADRGLVRPRDEFPSDESYNIYLEKHIQYNNFKERLKEYDKYMTIKKQIKEKRNATQVLLEPNSGEDERFKSS
jgi:hypothetical protein